MKYMGSKSRIAKDIVPIIQGYIDSTGASIYIEPFVGGANVIQHIKCDRRIGSDLNRYLIALWKKVIKGWNPPSVVTREMYNLVKDNKDNYPDELVATIGFCATYNAKWYGGYAGKVKTKVGTYRDYYDESVRNIIKQAPYLHDVEFINANYKNFLNVSNAVIYCDPPYKDTTKYDATDGLDYEEFWEWVRVMSSKNIVLVSEYNAPSDFTTLFEKTLSVTLNNNGRTTNTEKLFIYDNCPTM